MAAEAQATKTNPSSRSIQTGTLMSIGSVDPRAPTELSLPSPRGLSESERAGYLIPEAVVDRTPSPGYRYQDALAKDVEAAPVVERRPGSISEPPYSSERELPRLSAELESSGQRAQGADSIAPAARHFRAAPRSDSPLPAGARPATSAQGSADQRAAPRFQIHSQIDALPYEFGEDNFDLRTVSTQREPLAGRQPMPSSERIPMQEAVSERRDSTMPSESGARPTSMRAPPLSAPPMAVPPSAVSFGGAPPGSVPRGSASAESVAPPRTPIQNFVRAAQGGPSVPLSWVLAAVLALLLALFVAWVMRAPAEPGALPQVIPRERAAETGLLPGPTVAPGQAALPTPQAGRSSADKRGPLSGNAALQRATAARTAEGAGSSSAAAVPSASAAAQADLGVPAASASDAPKAHQSIY